MDDSDSRVILLSPPGVYNKIKKIFKMNRYEFVLVAILSIMYFLSIIFNEIELIIVLGFIVGSWYIARPSEWLYNGVNNLRIYLGLREYLMGVLSAFATIAAEIFIVVLALYRALTLGFYELIEIAVLSTLFTMSFNILILGFVAVRVGSIPVALSEDELVKEMGIINWTMMASFLLVFMVFTKFVFADGSFEGDIYIPKLGAALLPISYMVYIYALRRRSKTERTIPITEATLTFRQAIIATIGGVAGSLVGSEMIVRSAELLLRFSEGGLLIISDPIVLISLIIGLASALHDLILNLLFTVKRQFSASAGNLIGTTIQMLLLLLGFVGIFVPIPLTDYITFELIVISFSLWFIRMSLADKKIDDYDGALLITLQFLSYILIFQGFII